MQGATCRQYESARRRQLNSVLTGAHADFFDVSIEGTILSISINQM